MNLYQQSEATAAYRRVFLHLVDATDGISAETGEAAGQPQLSKNGAAFGNTSATLTSVGNGAYYVELTAGELDTLGFFIVRYKSANTAEAQVMGQVVAFDPYDAVRAGLTALPNANAEAAGGLYTRGTGAGQINQNANGQVDTRTVAMDTGVVTAAAVATGAIDADALGADCITAAKIADDAIASEHIATGAIVAATFAAGAIDAAAIAADAIGSSEFAQAAADKVWSTAARALTDKAGFSISGTKQTLDALNDVSAADVNAQCDTALTDIGLDHLLSASVIGTDITDDSIIAKLVSKEATADWDDFVNTTDSLQAIRDNMGTAQTGDVYAQLPTNFSSMGIEADGHVHGDVKEWLGVAPNALQSGRVDGYTGAMAANVLTATAINGDAITEAKIADNAIAAEHLATTAVAEIANAILPKKNTAFDNIEFLLVQSSDHVTPKTSATGLGVERSIDGGAFGSGTGTGPTEVSDGIYQYDASAADMNGTVVTFRFYATDCDDTFVTIKTTD